MFFPAAPRGEVGDKRAHDRADDARHAEVLEVGDGRIKNDEEEQTKGNTSRRNPKDRACEQRHDPEVSEARRTRGLRATPSSPCHRVPRPADLPVLARMVAVAQTLRGGTRPRESRRSADSRWDGARDLSADSGASPPRFRRATYLRNSHHGTRSRPPAGRFP